MSILDKVMFWKREEPEMPSSLDNSFFDSLPGTPPGLTPTSLDSDNGYNDSPPPRSFGPGIRTISPSNQTQSDRYEPDKLMVIGKDIEILSAKMDMLKSSIDALNARISSLEMSMNRL